MRIRVRGGTCTRSNFGLFQLIFKLKMREDTPFAGCENIFKNDFERGPSGFLAKIMHKKVDKWKNPEKTDKNLKLRPKLSTFLKFTWPIQFLYDAFYSFLIIKIL